MKTTVELPDALAAEAKQVAREHKATLRDLVVAGLRAELDRRRTFPELTTPNPLVGQPAY